MFMWNMMKVIISGHFPDFHWPKILIWGSLAYSLVFVEKWNIQWIGPLSDPVRVEIDRYHDRFMFSCLSEQRSTVWWCQIWLPAKIFWNDRNLWLQTGSEFKSSFVGGNPMFSCWPGIPTNPVHKWYPNLVGYSVSELSGLAVVAMVPQENPPNYSTHSSSMLTGLFFTPFRKINHPWMQTASKFMTWPMKSRLSFQNPHVWVVVIIIPCISWPGIRI